jgi:adenine/guanine phosphoribosyltransferase-like PRPP-binding protein
VTEPLDELVCQYVDVVDGGRAIGFAPNLRVEVFVDLLSAALVPARAKVLVEALLAKMPQVDRDRDGIVAPKWGNPVFGSELAKALGIPLLLARDDRLFGRWFDGNLEHHRRWFLVDDVASDGERLVELVERAQDEGVKISAAYFVVLRREGDAAELLTDEGIPIEALREWDDEDLRRLLAEWRGRSDGD